MNTKEVVPRTDQLRPRSNSLAATQHCLSERAALRDCIDGLGRWPSPPSLFRSFFQPFVHSRPKVIASLCTQIFHRPRRRQRRRRWHERTTEHRRRRRFVSRTPKLPCGARAVRHAITWQGGRRGNSDNRRRTSNRTRSRSSSSI